MIYLKSSAVSFCCTIPFLHDGSTRWHRRVLYHVQSSTAVKRCQAHHWIKRVSLSECMCYNIFSDSVLGWLTLKGELLEILYEPDIPWFKCLTLGKDKEAVTRIIKDLLLELVNSEVASLDFDAPQDVKAPEPRLISWGRYQSLDNDKHDEYTQYQFPAFMASLPYKKIWRGLEHSRGTFDSFLSDFRRLIKSENAATTTAEFKLYNECHISYNMRNNLVYIGSSTSAAALKKVIGKLETALDLLVSFFFFCTKFTAPNTM